jgi:hypothetical protein
VGRARLSGGSLALALAMAAWTWTLGAVADEPSEPKEPETPSRSPLIGRPHTVAELETGVLVLPTAPISESNRGGNTPIGQIGKGDATLQLGAHMLYRQSRLWAFGAGAMFAPAPTSDSNYKSGPSGPSNPPRTHSRSYLTLGGEVRFMFPELRSRSFEAWLGLTGGAVIVADRFDTNAGADVPPILGSKEVTISSAGLAVGAQLGGDWLLSENLVFGVVGRASLWFLPSAPASANDPACDSFGDCPTLSGAVQAFELGISLGYRIPL